MRSQLITFYCNGVVCAPTKIRFWRLQVVFETKNVTKNAQRTAKIATNSLNKAFTVAVQKFTQLGTKQHFQFTKNATATSVS